MLKIKINRLITYIFFIICSAISYSQDNYIFESHRIKKVFCQWEITREYKKDYELLRLYNKEENIFVDISNYAKEDTKKVAEKRFHEIAVEGNYKYIGKDTTSKKYLKTTSIKYKGENIFGTGIKNNIFLVSNIEKFTIY